MNIHQKYINKYILSKSILVYMFMLAVLYTNDMPHRCTKISLSCMYMGNGHFYMGYSIKVLPPKIKGSIRVLQH